MRWDKVTPGILQEMRDKEDEKLLQGIIEMFENWDEDEEMEEYFKNKESK